MEINGAEGSIVFQLEQPHQLQVTRKGEKTLRSVQVPREFLVWGKSPRNPAQGDPNFSFRYDQNFEFIDAIRSQRACQPSFFDGALAQRIMDSAAQSSAEARWIDVSDASKELNLKS